MTGTKISQYPPNTNPPDSFEFLGTDPTNFSEGPTGTTETVPLSVLAAKIGGGGSSSVTWKDLVGTYGADPTGATSSSTALANACSAAASAGTNRFGLWVPPGTYTLNEPQVIPQGMVMMGAGCNGGTPTGAYDGTTFSASSSFSGSALLEVNDTPDGPGVNGPVLSGFALYGANYTAEAVDGLLITGPCFTKIRDVNIIKMSGNGVNTHVDATASPIGADGMDFDGMTVDSCAGIGMRLVWPEDGQFANIYVIGCGGDGWQIAGGDNSHFDRCRAEWSGGYGLHLTNITDGGDTYTWSYTPGYIQFNGFSTDANYQSGVRIDGTWTPGGAGTGPCTVNFSNLTCRRDGQQYSGASGSWAGIDVDYSGATGGALGLPVYVNGVSVITGVPDTGSGMAPRYGVRANATGTAPFKLSGSGLVMGLTAAALTGGTVTNYSLASSIDTYAGNNYSYPG